ESALSQPGAEQSNEPRTRTHAMQHGHRPASSEQIPATLVPERGWHFLHLFYRVDRQALCTIPAERRQRGLDDFRQLWRAGQPGAPEQMQCFAVPGHKADFGVVMAGPDLRAIHDVQMTIQAGALGPALAPVYSFYSISEVSEYVPDEA